MGGGWRETSPVLQGRSQPFRVGIRLPNHDVMQAIPTPLAYFSNHLARGAEAKFEIDYSMTQTVNLCFDNPHQVTGTLAYILDENIIMYAEGSLIHPLPQENASRVQVKTTDSFPQIAFGENGKNSSSLEAFGEGKNAVSRVSPWLILAAHPSVVFCGAAKNHPFRGAVAGIHGDRKF